MHRHAVFTGQMLGGERRPKPHPDGPRVIVFTLGMAVAAGYVAGVTPALETLRFDLVTSLKSASMRGGPAVSPRLRCGLIANQLSISLALLIVIGLIVRAQSRLMSSALDYDAKATIVAEVDLPHIEYSGPSARAFYDGLLPLAIRSAFHRTTTIPTAERPRLDSTVESRSGPASDAANPHCSF